MNQEIKYKLTKEQAVMYEWLKKENINTDDETLCYWAKSYTSKRIKEVVNFAKTRKANGQNIRNIGGWIQKFLKTNQIVVNESCMLNRSILKQFLNETGWNDLLVYEKYVRDKVTGEDLPLTIESDDFKRGLERLYQKSRLYK